MKLEKCRDLVWSRAIVPEDAVDVSHGRLIGLADFAQNMVQGVWAGFLRKNGEYSCSLVLGRAKIGSEDTTYTTARGELESTANLSALLRTVTNSMVGWIDAELTIIGNDSEIAVYWLLTDKLRLNVFTGSKVSQFRLNARVDQLYHVSTESNLADLGSRLDLDNFDVNDLGALGKWHKGLSWMCYPNVQEMMDEGHLTHGFDLKVKDDLRSQYEEGLLLEKLINKKKRIMSMTECNSLAGSEGNSKEKKLDFNEQLVEVDRCLKDLIKFQVSDKDRFDVEKKVPDLNLYSQEGLDAMISPMSAFPNKSVDDKLKKVGLFPPYLSLPTPDVSASQDHLSSDGAGTDPHLPGATCDPIYMSMVNVVTGPMQPLHNLVSFVKEFEVLDMAVDQEVIRDGDIISDITMDIKSGWLMEEILSEDKVNGEK